MIALERGETPPEKLRNDSDGETDLLIEAYESGEEVEPKGSVYNHKSVKELLEVIQYEKCAFCETKLKQQFGNVEHFRPKKAIQKVRGGPLHTPGYFWLSYEWSNLSLSCEVCNITYKRNYFPIIDESRRADPVTRDVSLEEPLLIDPYSVDPEEHLCFEGWNILARDESRLGEESIVGLGLDSDDLDESRRDRLMSVELILEAAEETDSGHDAMVRLVDYLRVAVSDAGEYSAVVRANYGARIAEVMRRVASS